MKFTIKQARQYAGLTQKEVANQLGVGIATYRTYEWGNSQMRMDKAKEFSKLTGIDLDNLIFLQSK
ncbi:helix-turn-helix transcriptional regulator [Limosilactobacillus vaginalis]|uniref:helix-turn-helix transcriptional regulator n=1 Tax=Limosilactobacillus vaginalis TaxID=1633 RepID=UPI0036155543